ncbi:DUF4189 domain-containing protein [Mycobacterium sp. E2733]|uniref:DUF4189 domain-containing protein n=1 Tax=Mycobacterium sp. E2733 TaxID=1834138 RepID=UPI0009EDF451|nr:DUF4189 domain-containing protein [Mycobacterium sp. E2733]
MNNKLNAGVGALLVGVAMVAAPVAHSDPGWVAVAASDREDHTHWSWGPASQGAAEGQALAACRNTGGPNCHVIASGTPCLALVEDAEDYHWGIAGNADDAMANAKARAVGELTIDGVHCIWDIARG